MGYKVTLEKYDNKRFIAFTWEGGAIAKALFRSFTISVAKAKSFLKRADEIQDLIDNDDNGTDEDNN
jgi:hypothetical protein